jgi:hypothetical protein
MVSKTIEVVTIIRNVEALQQYYNELNQVNFKGHNDLKVPHNNYDWLMRNYGKMKAINI